MTEHVRHTRQHPRLDVNYVAAARPLHVSDTSISSMEFARYQRRSAERYLCDLVWECRNRYVYALELIRPFEPLPHKVAYATTADLGELRYAWDAVCTSYRSLAFDCQIDLFEPQDKRELERWHDFVRRQCIDAILERPAHTLNVLHAAGLVSPDPSAESSINDPFTPIILSIKQRYS